MKAAFPRASTSRTVIVFIVTYLLLSMILHVGMDLRPTGVEQIDRELQAVKPRIKFLSLEIPIEWLVPPFLVISATLIAWLDSRRQARRTQRS